MFKEKEADSNPYPGVLVVLVPISEVNIHKVLVNTGSSLNILYNNTLEWIDIPLNFLQPYPNMVMGLNGALSGMKRPIKLPIKVEEPLRRTKLNAKFVVLNSKPPYDAIMG